MKKIEAIVRKEKFEEVFRALEDSGIGGLTVTEAKGFGHHRNGLQEKMKLDIYADEFQVDKIVETIRKYARTGVTGDGKIAVIDMSNIIRIRDGQTGASAI
ncbi:MAG: P-II family nitrogen regulator [Candidatus Omnitrophica bacterium]|nr:P-II family nitrogen regulator [Candidatus Omnitrophota bacterium]